MDKLPTIWSLKITSESLPYINQVRAKNPNSNYRKPLNLDASNKYVTNETEENITYRGAVVGIEITLEDFKQHILGLSSDKDKSSSSLPKIWSLEVTKESIKFINRARQDNPHSFYRGQIILGNYPYVSNVTGNITGNNEIQGELITLETFKELVLDKNSVDIKKNSDSMSLSKDDLKDGVWYKFKDISLIHAGKTYFFKYDKKISDITNYPNGTEYSVDGCYNPRRVVLSSFRGYEITLATHDELIQFLSKDHPDIISKQLVLGTFNIGDIVVSEEHKPGARKVGDLFVVLPQSSKNCLYYHLDYCSVSASSWRKATSKEKLAYYDGIKNINDIPPTKSESTMKYKVGDKVKYLGEDTEIVKFSITEPGYYIVKYSGGWSQGPETKDLPPGNYHYAKESSLTLIQPSSNISKKIEPRFKVGDKITYKSRASCKDGRYKYGGEDHAGYVGIVQDIHFYCYDCYKISVTSRAGGYMMLESEFEEYDSPGIDTTKFTIAMDNYDVGLASSTHKKSNKLETIPHQREVILQIAKKKSNKLVTI